MQLYLFRLSLKERSQIDAFERAAPSGTPFNREAWLRDILSREIEFRHRNSEFFYVPAKPDPSIWPGRMIPGWIARQRLVGERLSPSEGLEVTEHASWQAALVLLDPSDHDDGQKLAMEARQDIGKPASVLPSLVAAINETYERERFSAQIFPITRSRSFSDFVGLNRTTIRKITYETAVPNMFTNKSDWDDDMRVLRDKGNVSNVKQRLRAMGP